MVKHQSTSLQSSPVAQLPFSGFKNPSPDHSSFAQNFLNHKMMKSFHLQLDSRATWKDMKHKTAMGHCSFRSNLSSTVKKLAQPKIAAKMVKASSFNPEEACSPERGHIFNGSPFSFKAALRLDDDVEMAPAAESEESPVESASNSEKNEKYYKKFDFFYRRTAFRSMTEFYKGLFKPHLDKWREGERKSTKNFLNLYLTKKCGLRNWKEGSKKQQQLVKGESKQVSSVVPTFSNASPIIDEKIEKALAHSFEPYEHALHTDLPVAPISDADKKILKHNTRKQNLFESAYYFTDKLFGLSTPSESGELDSSMSTDQLMQFTSSILSIVLSHHFQKNDIKKMINGSKVDFQIVRDTMYKYSKKAEERFFKQACLAYLFVQFYSCPQGKDYISNKLAKCSNQEEELNQPQNTSNDHKVGQCSTDEARQQEMNIRIESEIRLMSQEALQYLIKTFQDDLHDLIVRHHEEGASNIEALLMEESKQLLTYQLLQNLKVDTSKIIFMKMTALKSNGLPLKKEKPLIDSLLEDFSNQMSQNNSESSKQEEEPPKEEPLTTPVKKVSLTEQRVSSPESLSKRATVKINSPQLLKAFSDKQLSMSLSEVPEPHLMDLSIFKKKESVRENIKATPKWNDQGESLKSTETSSTLPFDQAKKSSLTSANPFSFQMKKVLNDTLLSPQQNQRIAPALPKSSPELPEKHAELINKILKIFRKPQQPAPAAAGFHS